MTHPNPKTQKPNPLFYSVEKLSTLLYKIDPDIPYGEWLRALAAIYYETNGSEKGFELVNDWSSWGRKYRGSRDIRTKWRSFSLTVKRPVTAATLIWIAENVKVNRSPSPYTRNLNSK